VDFNVVQHSLAMIMMVYWEFIEAEKDQGSQCSNRRQQLGLHLYYSGTSFYEFGHLLVSHPLGTHTTISLGFLYHWWLGAAIHHL